MDTIKVAIVGWGNVGKFCKQVIENCADMELVGVVRRESSLQQPQPPELEGIATVSDIHELEPLDVAIVCVPSPLAFEREKELLSSGIACVDSFDIHKDILISHEKLTQLTKENRSVCIYGAGWDPGTDSLIRAVMQIVSPNGVSTTTFGGVRGGRSMGHTVAVKAIEGVKDAVSLTLPNGAGKQKRQVYVELEKGADFNSVAAAIRADQYFAQDPTDVIAVKNVAQYDTLNHGGQIDRVTPEVVQSYRIEGINPFMTANVLVCAARAAYRATERQEYGAFTMLERPLCDFLSGTLDELLQSY